MSIVKRERWHETDVFALPSGEHDYFDRKSGRLLDGPHLDSELAKLLSALANSGGGHVLLGVNDDGSVDGVDPFKGNTSTREWLEQKIPTLLIYPLQDFRVHEVKASTPSDIPTGKVIIAIDVGDSILAPHQSRFPPFTYFYRAGSHSLPAPHFYLETLRNRLVNAILEPSLASVKYVTVTRHVNEWLFVELKLTFVIANVGRVASHNWAVVVTTISDHNSSRLPDYKFSTSDFPDGAKSSNNICFDSPILPSLSCSKDLPFGFYLRPDTWNAERISAEFEGMFPRSLSLGYRAVSEASPGHTVTSSLGKVCDFERILKKILERV